MLVGGGSRVAGCRLITYACHDRRTSALRSVRWLGRRRTLFAGVVVWGGIGWLIDLWLDTTFVKAIGVLVGLATAIYLVVVKYGDTG
jgi:hypothetical protein